MLLLFLGLSGKIYFLVEMCSSVNGSTEDVRFPGLELPSVESKLELYQK